MAQATGKKKAPKPKASGTAFVGPGGDSTIRRTGTLRAVDLAYWIVKRTDWRGQDAAKAIAVARCESGLRTTAHHASPDEDSWGVFQINLKAHKGITPTQARDPEFAVQFARGLWGAAGNSFARDWVTCSRAAVRQSDLDAVDRMVRGVGSPAEAVASGGAKAAEQLGEFVATPFTHFIIPALKIAAGGLFLLAALGGILAVAALARGSRDVVRQTVRGPVGRVKALAPRRSDRGTISSGGRTRSMSGGEQREAEAAFKWAEREDRKEIQDWRRKRMKEAIQGRQLEGAPPSRRRNRRSVRERTAA